MIPQERFAGLVCLMCLAAVVPAWAADHAAADLSAAFNDTVLVADESDGVPIGSRTPLILIHGSYGTSSLSSLSQTYFQGLINALKINARFTAKYKIYRFHYLTDTDSVHDLGQAFRDRVDEAINADANFDKPLLLIAHGLGGLVARSYAQEALHGAGRWTGLHGGDRVLRLLTLSTPHHGTPVAMGPSRDVLTRTADAIAGLPPLAPVSVGPSGFLDSWTATFSTSSFWSYFAGTNTVSGSFFSPFAPWYLPNRSDQLWDNYDSLLATTQPDLGSWLGQLNQNTTYDSALKVYGGYLDPTESTYSALLQQVSVNGPAAIVPVGSAFPNQHQQLLAASVAQYRGLFNFLSGAFPFSRSDGVVPTQSSSFTGHQVQAVLCPGYDHESMQMDGIAMPSGMPSQQLCANGIDLLSSVVSDLSATPGKSSILSVSASGTLDFGTVAVGLSRALTLILSNTGTETLVVSRLVVSGTNSNDFRADGVNLPVSLSPNASVTVTITFTPASQGLRTASVSFQNTSDNASPELSVALTGVTPGTVVKSSQTITFAAIGDMALGSPPFPVSVSASSGLPVTLTSNTPAVCAVAGTTVTLVGTGVCSLTASQAGSATYNPATSVTRSFTVTARQVALSITVNPLGTGTVSAVPSSGGSYAVGSTVQVTGIPATGYMFTGFSGDLTGNNNPQSLTMTAARSVVANFRSVSSPGASASIALSSSQNPVRYGSPVTLTANLSPASATGRVTFYDGTAVLGTSSIANGKAVLSTSTLSFGSRALRAYYGGDITYSASVSPAISQTVGAVAENGFAAPVSYVLRTGPTSVAAADFNGDGNVDLAVSNGIDSSVSILLGAGAGLFSAPVTYPAGSGPNSVAVADFNGDGNADLAVANLNDNTISVLLGNGDGTFRAALTYPCGAGPTSLAVADLNGDGRADLVVLSLNSNSVSILLGQGDGNLRTATSYPAGNLPVAIAVADFNRDGKVDLAVANPFDNVVNILLGNGDGSLSSPVPYAANAPGALVAIDLNGDGYVDVAVAGANDTSGRNVSVLLGNGDGTLQAASPYAAGTNPSAIAAADFNGDSVADLVVVDQSANASVLIGRGDGTFQAAVTYPVSGLNHSAVAVSDFNGDGRADLVVAWSGTTDGGGVNVLLAMGTSQAITFSTLPGVVLGAAPFSISASASSGLSVRFTSTTPSVCTVNTNVVTLLSAGTCSITAEQAGNSEYAAATPVIRSFVVSATNQTILFNPPPGVAFGTAPFSLAATASSGLAVIFTSATPPVCSVSGAVVSILSAGTCTITASQPGNGSYLAASPVTQSFSVNPANQTITFGTLPDVTYGVAPFTISATASSGLVVSLSSTTPSVCSVTGTTVTILAGGACSIAATQSGNGSYLAAPQLTRTFGVSAASQSITFAPLNNVTYGVSPLSISATASSGLVVSFSSTTLSVCSVSGRTATILAAGTCSIAATQPGNASYLAAPPVTQSFLVNPANQTINFGTLPDVAYGVSPFPISATASSGLVVSFSSTTPFVCSVSGTTVTILAGGACSISATQPGNGSYLAAPQVTRTFMVSVTNQSITFAPLNNVTYGVPPFPVSATASSGLTVSFSSTTPLVCGVSGTTVSILAGGACSISATQPGNGSYLAAPQVTRTFTVSAANQSITFAPLNSVTYGVPPFSVAATASSGLVVSFFSTTPSVCSVSGTMVTILTGGACSISATQPGNGSYSAAPQVTRTFAVAAAKQSITFAPLNNVTYGVLPFGISAVSSSGLAVSFASAPSSVCSVLATTVTILSAGTCSVTATQTGNSVYSAATPVTQSFVVNPASQTISFAPLADVTFGTAPISLSATTSSGLSVTFASSTTAICTLSGNMLSFLAPGTCSITAAQTGTGSISAAPAVTRSLAVKPITVIRAAATHSGNFTRGQQGALYRVLVSNGGAASTSGPVTVADTLPSGLTAVAIGGVGWTCDLASLTCTRADTLAAASSYPAITIALNVSPSAQGQVTNLVNAAGGGALPVVSSDLTSLAGAAPTGVNGGGAGYSQAFTFSFNAPGGFSTIQLVDILISDALDGRRACYLAFLPSGNSGALYLVNDAGDAGGPYAIMNVPGSSSIQNSQCSINGTGSSVSANGTTLTLTLPITFSSGFAGRKIIYLAAGDTAGMSSGWQPVSTWSVPAQTAAALSTGLVNPPQNSSFSRAYTFSFFDNNGWQDIGVADILVNDAIDGRSGCYVAFLPISATSGWVYLVNDAGDAGGPYAIMQIPGTNSVQNSQCVLDGLGSSVSASGTALNVTLSTTFTPGFSGNRVFYLATGSKGGQNSGWQAAGSVNIP